MKRTLSVLLITALVAPLFLLSGCACNDGADRMGQHTGGK